MQHVVKDRNSTLNKNMIASHIYAKITYKLGCNENQHKVYRPIVTSANDQCKYVGIMPTFVLRPKDRKKY